MIRFSGAAYSDTRLSPEAALRHNNYIDILSKFERDIRQQYPNDQVINTQVSTFITKEKAKSLSESMYIDKDEAIAKNIVLRAQKHFGIDHKAVRILADILMIALSLAGVGLLAIGLKKTVTGNCFFYIGKNSSVRAVERIENKLNKLNDEEGHIQSDLVAGM